MGRKRVCETESRRRKQKGEGGRRDGALRPREMNNINVRVVRRLEEKIKQAATERRRE